MIDPGRIRSLKSGSFSGNAVLYWMIRDKRVSDNWALIVAQQTAIKNRVPLIVCFQYIGKFPESNLRQNGFLFKGLIETQKKLEALNIEFLFLQGKPEDIITDTVNKRSIGTIIVDHNPLKVYRKRIKRVIEKIDIPVYQVDAHNIVPCWKVSEKKEYAAYTLRPKIHNNLKRYLTDIPEIIPHPYGKAETKIISYDEILNDVNCDLSILEVDWLKPGESAAKEALKVLKTKLEGYSVNRNDPTKGALSDLSPYFHFGHIAPQRVAWEINNSNLNKEDKEAFLEEMIVRRELSDNFCEYEPNYDFFEGFHSWAQKTLNEHRNDEREYLYPLGQFEAAQTHDDLWNAAQNEMKNRGKMHGYMRMYWAKKILEWTPAPEVALQIAIELNDKYELDGRDPNGYAGIAWSIGGIHDRAWFERPIYGKIRYMNYNGCKSKFNVNEYIKIHNTPNV
tara:strand:+ start:188 stop:1537 length:1350 start_codon:yes stop_codon:yes gene_type:complete